jgi:acetyl-CoA synthetase (ADP-forming)
MEKFPIFEKAKKEGRLILTEYESKKLLKQVGIPVVETRLAKTQKETVLMSQKIGFPVVLKIASPDVIHKSDSGGVKLSLNNVAGVKKAYGEIMERVRELYPNAVIYGITVQKMARPGTEVIVGTSKDPQFGPVIMFGLGGIFVEVLKDVSFRVIPLNRRDAQEMIKEIKGYPLLQGMRGKEPVNIRVLVDIILKISNLIEGNPQIKELELNPIFAYGDGAVAVDARIILERDECGAIEKTEIQK